MSSLGAFLDAMYKKRELEYKAALAQSEADVKGAQAIGQGIASIGSAVGSIGQGIGGYMKQSALDKSAMAIGREEGNPLTSTGFGASAELNQRIAAGQFKDNSITPYQQSTLDLAVAAENRRRQEGLERTAGAATARQSKQFTDTANDNASYFHNSEANMAKLYDADTPEKFSLFQKNQMSLNNAGVKAGVPEDQLYQVPKEFIPKSAKPAYNLAAYQANPQNNPTQMRRLEEQVETAGGQRVGTGQGDLPPQGYTTGVNMPAGAIPVPGLRGQPGEHTATYNGKPYIWDGSFMVPNPNKK